MGNRSRQRGFTLVEVLVATVVLALGLLAALVAFSMATRVAAASTVDTTVSLLAQRTLTELQLQGSQNLPTGTTSGDFGPDYPNYFWQQTIYAKDEMNLSKVDLIIYAQEAGRRREIRFSTAIF